MLMMVANVVGVLTLKYVQTRLLIKFIILIKHPIFV